MKLIPLTQGKFTKVDDEDFDFLNQFKWTAHRSAKTFYAVRSIKGPEGKRKVLRMHVILSKPEQGQQVHHIDDDGINNQKENLRNVSRSEHRRADLKLRKDNTTGYRGVYRQKPFRAEIQHGGKTIFLGHFDFAEEAARTRDAKARELGWPEEGMNFPQ